MKILVADDDRTSRLMIQYMLKGSGYDVVTAADGLEAVARLSDPDAPRLALVDWMMPGLDGPDVCQAIRRLHARSYTYFLLLTARDSKDDLVTGLQSGADDYITKPCHPEELRARLRTGERILRLEDSLIAARDEMAHRAAHDALTGLLNRGAIVNRLTHALREAAAAGETLTVLLGDVDHFKAINDTHGHPAGDDVLCEVARRASQAAATHPANAVGRFGGEEFLFLLRDTTASQAEAIRTAIAATPIAATPIAATPIAATPITGLTVTMSLGALTVAPGALADVDEALRAADELLYRAKRAGRNRVVHSTVTRSHTALPDATPERRRAGDTLARSPERSGLVPVARPQLIRNAA